jgi:hypothetical protein
MDGQFQRAVRRALKKTCRWPFPTLTKNPDLMMISAIPVMRRPGGRRRRPPALGRAKKEGPTMGAFDYRARPMPGRALKIAVVSDPFFQPLGLGAKQGLNFREAVAIRRQRLE